MEGQFTGDKKKLTGLMGSNRANSTNGYHVGLEVEDLELIFDNVGPKGLSRAQWLDDIHLPYYGLNVSQVADDVVKVADDIWK